MNWPDGWPPRFRPHEWDCYDKRGTLGKRGALIAKLPLEGRIHENARGCAWNLHILQLHLAAGELADGPAIRIISGWRPYEYNKAIKGSPDSRHLYGDAADFKVAGFSPRRVAKELDRLQQNGLVEKGGLHAYGFSFTHYDTRGWNARW